MSETTTKTDAAAKLRVNEQKWTKPLMDAGWTAFPSVIVECQDRLGLDATDINILLHLASHWWTLDNKPHPSKGSIAKAMRLDPRTIQRRIANMEAVGLIRREERRETPTGSKPNLYHFDGLIEQATPFALEKLEDIAAKKEVRKIREARKGKPKLHLVKSEVE